MTVGLLASRRLVLVAGLLTALAVAAVPPVRARVANSARDLFLPGNRYDIWVAAIDIVKRFPMGVGRKNGEILRDYPTSPSTTSTRTTTYCRSRWRTAISGSARSCGGWRRLPFSPGVADGGVLRTDGALVGPRRLRYWRASWAFTWQASSSTISATARCSRSFSWSWDWGWS